MNITFRSRLELDFEMIYKKRLIEKNLFIKNNNYFLQYMNYIHRYISERPRKVFESKKFQVPEKYKKQFDCLKNKIIKGQNINLYQSTQLEKPSKIDQLFNYDQLLHLHLTEYGEIKNKKKLTKKHPEDSDHLAIAFLTENEIYFLKIHVHNGAWVNPEYFEIIENEFPELIKNKIKISENLPFDADLITKCRMLGINYEIKNGGEKSYKHEAVSLGGNLIKHTTKKDSLIAIARYGCYQIEEGILNQGIKAVGDYQIRLKEINEDELVFVFHIFKNNEPYKEITYTH
jgi:hypothetical protein